jgi:ribosomal protein S18 acetylase RimI-like enzyme
VQISIADLEQAAAGGWRAPEEARLGRWLLRAAGGFTGRANSALAAGDPGMPLGDAAAEVRRWYQARGLPAMIAVPYPAGDPRGSPVDGFLARLGWTVRPGTATVMTAAPGTVAARTAGATAAVRVDVDDEPDGGWLALHVGSGLRPPPMARLLLMSAPWQAFASVREAGGTVAIGRLAVADGWAGLNSVQVHPGQRRRGLGRAITGALAAAAARRAVAGLYLQVEDGNAAARALYRQAGFADHHGYHYRVAPGQAAQARRHRPGAAHRQPE